MPDLEGARPSAPMSPLPPPPSEPAPRRHDTDPHGPGWRPAVGDRSSKAIEWHALRGSRVADEARALATQAIDGLGALTKQIKATDDRWSARWTTLARVGWPVLIALCIMAACGLAGIMWSIATRIRIDPPAPVLQAPAPLR